MVNYILEAARQGDVVFWLVLTLALVFFGGVVASIRMLFPAADPVAERLRAQGLGVGSGVSAAPASIVLKAGGGGAAVDERSPVVSQLLVHAGFRGDRAMSIFVAVKVGLAVGGPVVFLLLWPFYAKNVENPGAIAVALCLGGFFLPNLWLFLRARARKTAIERALPDAMDLMVTCVEAGLGLDATLSRVAQEMAIAAPILANEMQLTFLEIKAGINRAEAFRRLADRTGVEDLKFLAATLAQTELFGTSIAAALRMRADWIRNRRMQRAEERAATVSVKMSFPLIFLILPSLLIVVMGPGIIRIMTNLLPALGGGN